MEIALSQVKSYIKEDPVTWVRKIERFPHYFKILNYLFDHFLQHSKVVPLQSTIASFAGCSLSSTNRFIQRMKEWGLITVKQRGHSMSAVYYFSEDLEDKDLRKQLSIFFDCFSYMSFRELLEKILIAKQYISLDINMSYRYLIKIYKEIGSYDRCAEPEPLHKGKAMNEDNYNYREAAPPRELKPRNQLQTPPKGDKQTFVGSLETLSHAQLQAELHKELNKELSFNSNPRNLVGPDMRRVLALKKELARRDHGAKNDHSDSIMTAANFGHDY